MKRQFSACQTSRSIIPIYLQQFPSFRTASAKNRHFHVPQTTFLFPLGTPLGHHAKCCMNGKRIRCLKIVSQHVPIYLKQFPSYSQVQKIAIFTYRSPHFCFPWRRLCDYHAICSMDGKTIQFNACQTPRSMYLSIFNSFRVIRCLSQCVRPKIAIFITFLFPLGMPLGQSR